MRNRVSTAGFTLFEMTIVVVVIALIASSIIVVGDLVRSSQIQGMLMEVNRIKTSISTFKMRYNFLPGDFTGATALWGTHSAGCPLYGNGVQLSKVTTTCNGSGDGRVLDNFEPFAVWTHLSNAGLFEGMYSQGQVSATGGFTFEMYAGYNTAVSKKIKDATFTFSFPALPADSASSILFASHMLIGNEGIQKHRIIVGSYAATGPSFAGILSGVEALSLDEKLDDGKPGSGAITTFRTDAVTRGTGTAYQPSCASSNTASTATYRTDVPGNTCSLLFESDE